MVVTNFLGNEHDRGYFMLVYIYNISFEILNESE